MLAKFEFDSVCDAEKVYSKVFKEIGYRGGTSRNEDRIEVYESCSDPHRVRDICEANGGTATR